MNAVATADSPKVEKVSQAIDWYPLAAFALVWLEVIWRLQFEWSVNPQYSYGYAVPFLCVYAFWRRWQTAPAPAPPPARALLISLIIATAAVLVPIRLIQEANPDWRLLSWP